jgi:hypothetical protein
VRVGAADLVPANKRTAAHRLEPGGVGRAVLKQRGVAVLLGIRQKGQERPLVQRWIGDEGRVDHGRTADPQDTHRDPSGALNCLRTPHTHCLPATHGLSTSATYGLLLILSLFSFYVSK